MIFIPVNVGSAMWESLILFKKKIPNNFACIFMIPFMICCRLIKLPEKQYALIEEIIFHWANRQYDYELYYDVDVGVTDKQPVEFSDVRMQINKCEYCERLINVENNHGHCGWCPESVNPDYGKRPRGRK
jgi:hypothetical protein